MLPSEKQLLMDDLNNQFRHHGATHLIDAVLKHRVLGQVAMVSSFGASKMWPIIFLQIICRPTPLLPKAIHQLDASRARCLLE